MCVCVCVVPFVVLLGAGAGLDLVRGLVVIAHDAHAVLLPALVGELLAQQALVAQRAPVLEIARRACVHT